MTLIANLESGLSIRNKLNAALAKTDLVFAQGADIASASSIDLAASTGEYVKVTGNNNISSIVSAAAGVERLVQFTGNLTLVHSANLVIPGGADVAVVPGDIARFISDGSGLWRVLYFRKDGTVLVLDTNTSLAANSDAKIATQKATKAYADAISTALQAYADNVGSTAETYTDGAITALKDGVATPGNTLQKLYNLVLGASNEDYVADITARNAYNVPRLPFSLFVTDDGDGRWARYQATTTGTGATFVKLSDPDLLNALMSNSAIKVAYESNSDTNAFTNALKALLEQQSNTNTGDETAARIATINHGTSAKTVLVDGDEITGQNSESAFSLIRIALSDLWTYIKSKADTFYTPKTITWEKQVACSDETTAITAGTGKITFRMPYAMTLTAVRASLTTAQSSGSIFTVDINEGGTTILSTKLTINNTEKTSVSAAAAAVISDTALADDAEITIDVDQIGDGTAKGLKITLIGTR